MIDHAEIMNACDVKRQQFGLNALDEKEKIVTLLSYLAYDIVSSGTSNFLWREEYFAETVWALKQIEFYSAGISA